MLDENDVLTLDAAARWKKTVADALDTIVTWQQEDDEGKAAYSVLLLQSPLPQTFFADTQRLAIAGLAFPTVDAKLLWEVYKLITTWHADHFAKVPKHLGPLFDTVVGQANVIEAGVLNRKVPAEKTQAEGAKPKDEAANNPNGPRGMMPLTEAAETFGFKTKQLSHFLDLHPEVKQDRPRTKTGKPHERRRLVDIVGLAKAVSGDAAIMRDPVRKARNPSPAQRRNNSIGSWNGRSLTASWARVGSNCPATSLLAITNPGFVGVFLAAQNPAIWGFVDCWAWPTNDSPHQRSPKATRT